MKRAVFPSVLSGILLLAAPVLASSQNNSVNAAQERPGTDVSANQIEMFKHAKITLPRVIAAAKNQGAGALLDVTFDASNGKPVFKVKTYQNNEVWDVAVDAQSGLFVDYGKTTPEGELDAEDKAELAGLRQAKVTLAQAVATAEKSRGGKAMNAGLEAAHGRVVYEIMIVLETGSVRKVTVDPQSGALTDG
jgi:uncharacterized membrane protein YkoI